MACLQSHLERFLVTRQPPKTFCPSEVARALTADELSELGCAEWRDAMGQVREMVWQWRDAGRCEVLQKGSVLDPDTRLEDVVGPIRVRRTTD